MSNDPTAMVDRLLAEVQTVLAAMPRSREAAWAVVRRLAARLDSWLQPAPPYHNRWSRRVDRLMEIDSRIRLAGYVAWLAITGDQTFFQHYEARHVVGVERFVREHANRKELARLREAAKLDPDANLKEQIGAQRLAIEKLRREVRMMQEAAERRNRDLAALHIVWCDGGCEGGVGAPETLDKATVEAAVRNTRRLVRWWNTARWRVNGDGRDSVAESSRVGNDA